MLDDHDFKPITDLEELLIDDKEYALSLPARWSRYSDATGKYFIYQSVPFTCFLGKSKEAKEHESTKNNTPSIQFEGSNHGRVLPPKNCRECADGIPVEVNIGPAFPWVDWLRSDVEVQTVSRDRNCENDFTGCKTHETEILVDGKGCRRGEELAKLSTSQHESFQRENYER